MTIDEIMSREVKVVTPDTALMEIQERFHEHGFRHLLVVEDEHLVGVISDRDVLRAVSPFLDTLSEEPRDVKTLTRPAREVMHADPITVRPGTPIEEAGKLLLERSISCLPVITENGAIVGIVTSKDILRHYIE